MEEKTKTKTTTTTKITVTKQAEAMLDEMLCRVNDGFDGGRVTRQDLVSWVLSYFRRECFSESVEAIRQDHFDRVAYLEHVLKHAKDAQRAGAQIADLNALLGPILNVESGSPQQRGKMRRRPRKSDQLEMKETV